MKTFTLISILAICLAACSDSTPLIQVPDTTINDRHWSYEITTSYSDANVSDYSVECSANAICWNYPDSAFTISLGVFFASGLIDGGGTFKVDIDGDFSVDFVHTSSGGYVDSVFCTGFFSEDTLFLNYSYRNLETGAVGYVDVFSH